MIISTDRVWEGLASALQREDMRLRATRTVERWLHDSINEVVIGGHTTAA